MKSAYKCSHMATAPLRVLKNPSPAYKLLHTVPESKYDPKSPASNNSFKHKVRDNRSSLLFHTKAHPLKCAFQIHLQRQSDMQWKIQLKGTDFSEIWGERYQRIICKPIKLKRTHHHGSVPLFFHVLNETLGCERWFGKLSNLTSCLLACVRACVCVCVCVFVCVCVCITECEVCAFSEDKCVKTNWMWDNLHFLEKQRAQRH